MRGWLPTKGISAILELAHVVQKLAALNDPGPRSNGQRRGGQRRHAAQRRGGREPGGG